MTDPQSKSYFIGAHSFEAPSLEAALYLVATPVGNLGDVTLRALQVLAGAGVIYCEDTRVTAKLLERYGIRNRLRPYHDHNSQSAGASILAEVAAGQAVALCSDAGTPLISDPGFPLVRDCVAAGLKVDALPGASALLPALQLSAQPTDRFSFLGFLPQKAGERQKLLADIATRRETLVVYESPYRVLDALADMDAALGDRPISLSREISKLHEETLRGPSRTVHEALAARPAIKGEIVIVIGPSDGAPEPLSQQALDAAIVEALKDHPAGKAASLLAKSLGVPRDEIYARILELKSKA